MSHELEDRANHSSTPICQLPAELKLEVLRFVSLTCSLTSAPYAHPKQIRYKRDFRNLCLVSKAFRDLALPFLYEKVEIEGNDKDLKELVHFGNADRSGLQNCRSLTIAKTEQPMTLRRLPRGVARLWSGEVRRTSPGKFEEHLVLILTKFPENTLRTFRLLLRPGSFDDDTAILLLTKHNAFEHLHVPVIETYPKSVLSIIKARNLRTLDLDNRDLMRPKYFQYIMDNTPRLERLRLTRHSNTGPIKHSEAYWKQKILKHEKLRELSLEWMVLSNAGAWFEQMLDIPKITRLELRWCDGAEELLQLFTRAGSALSLTHLVVAFTNPKLDGSKEAVRPNAISADSCLTAICSACRKLTSVHVEYSPTSYPTAFFNEIDRFGSQLRSLSVDPYDEENFVTVCSSCPNLEQFGYCIPDHFLDDIVLADQTGTWHEEVSKFVDALRLLPRLEILHLNQYGPRGHNTPTEREHAEKTQEYRYQRFASTLFKTLGHNCTKLKVIVSGDGSGPSDQTDDCKEVVEQYVHVHGDPDYSSANTSDGPTANFTRRIKLSDARSLFPAFDILWQIRETGKVAHWAGRFRDY